MRHLLLALPFALLLPARPVAAAPCNTHTTGQAPFLCGYTFSAASLGNGTTSANGPEFFDQAGGVADTTSAGLGGLGGLARVEVDWGVVHAYASSGNGEFLETDLVNAEARTVSRAEGMFAERATVVSSSLPAGTPVTLTVTLAPEGGFTPGSGGQLDFVIANDANFLGTRVAKQGVFSAATFFVPEPFDFPAQVGDTLIFSYLLSVDTLTTNRASPVIPSAIADMEETARLFLDVGTPGAELESTSGHDYRTVPEPSRAVLLGIAALVLLRRRAPAS
jgi:hypothetical protein